MKYRKAKEKKRREEEKAVYKKNLREGKGGKKQESQKTPTKRAQIHEIKKAMDCRGSFWNLNCIHCEKLEMLPCFSCTGLLPEDGILAEFSNELLPKGCKTISYKDIARNILAQEYRLFLPE